MGLWPTHRDESPAVTPTDSKWAICDFRRSVMGIFRQLTASRMAEGLIIGELLSLPSSRQQLRELSSIVGPASKDLCVMNDPTFVHLVEGIRRSVVRLVEIHVLLIRYQRESGYAHLVEGRIVTSVVAFHPWLD